MTDPNDIKQDRDPNGCVRCGHLIGYHHLEGERCSAWKCDCPGYEDPPQARRPGACLP